MGDSINVKQDRSVTVGQCIVMDGNKVVYRGRIGIPLIPHILKPGVLLILHPVDFADGEDFRKNVWGKLN